MPEIIRQLDTELFTFINHLPHNYFSDSFFGFMTAIGYGVAIWVVIATVLTIRNKKITRKLFTAIIWAEVMYFFFIEYLIKNYFGRLRPQFLLPDAILPYDFSRSFSFPSGHAAIAFALSYVLGKIDRKRKVFYYFLAILISFSRIYLGKHYPSDVVGGAIVGMLIGYLSSLSN